MFAAKGKQDLLFSMLRWEKARSLNDMVWCFVSVTAYKGVLFDQPLKQVGLKRSD